MFAKKSDITIKTRFLIFFIFTLILSFINNIFLLIGLYFYLGICFFLLKRTPHYKIILLGDTFLFFLVLLLPIFSKHPPYYSFLGLKISISTLLYSISLFLKVTFLMILLNIFFRKEDIRKIVCFFKNLFLPNEISIVIFLSLRYLEELYNTFQNIQNAAKLRGFVKKTSINTYKIYGYMIASLLKIMLRKSLAINNALRLRGYAGKLFIECEKERINYSFLIFSIVYFLFLFLILKLVGL